jgi:NAD(P)-dependent dehydrogenase (short-subunit alcohol dehydrogenase family)
VQDFAGRTAVVTGAASGIGLALCERFADLGMNVVMADVEAATLTRVAGELARPGRSLLTVPTDVSRADALSTLAERAQSAFGPVHVLCNNAGVFAGGLCWQAPLSDYDWVFGVNVFGIVHALRSFVPGMLSHGEPGHIVNTASMAALTTAPFAGPYSMSKAAALSISETLFLELRSRAAKIGVSVLCPELVDTRIGRSERNRPPHLDRKHGEGDSPERDLVERAIDASTKTGLAPGVLADRTLAAIRDDRFYVLADEGDPWRVACHARLDDIRAARNPGSTPVPGS